LYIFRLRLSLSSTPCFLPSFLFCFLHLVKSIFLLLLIVPRERLSSIFCLLYLDNFYLPFPTCCASRTLIFPLLLTVPRELLSSVFYLFYIENLYLPFSTFCISRTLIFPLLPTTTRELLCLLLIVPR
jgi:hypothetical protein